MRSHGVLMTFGNGDCGQLGHGTEHIYDLKSVNVDYLVFPVTSTPQLLIFLCHNNVSYRH